MKKTLKISLSSLTLVAVGVIPATTVFLIKSRPIKVDAFKHTNAFSKFSIVTAIYVKTFEIIKNKLGGETLLIDQKNDPELFKKVANYQTIEFTEKQTSDQDFQLIHGLIYSDIKNNLKEQDINIKYFTVINPDNKARPYFKIQLEDNIIKMNLFFDLAENNKLVTLLNTK